MSRDEAREKAIELVGKAKTRGLSTQQITKKLKELGLKSEDASLIARATTFDSYVPEPEGKTTEEIRATIRARDSADQLTKPQSYAEELKKGRSSKHVKDIEESTTYKDIGVEDEKRKKSILNRGSGNKMA